MEPMNGNLDMSSVVLQPESIDGALKSCGESPITEEEMKMVIPANQKIKSFEDLKLVCPKFHKVVMQGFALNILNDIKKMMKRIKSSYKGH